MKYYFFLGLLRFNLLNKTYFDLSTKIELRIGQKWSILGRWSKFGFHRKPIVCRAIRVTINLQNEGKFARFALYLGRGPWKRFGVWWVNTFLFLLLLSLCYYFDSFWMIDCGFGICFFSSFSIVPAFSAVATTVAFI